MSGVLFIPDKWWRYCEYYFLNLPYLHFLICKMVLPHKTVGKNN